MIIGDGMLATAFMKAGIDHSSHIIFASGVSNSLEINQSEFDKEKALLHRFSPSDLRLVYFSTVSIFDPSLSGFPYIKHKLDMERIIQESFKKYLIIRLPIVVGKSSNPHTLTNFIYQSIITRRSFNLYQNAARYLIDIDDVVRMADVMIQKSEGSHIINLVLDNKIKVIALAGILEELTGTLGNYNITQHGSDYEIDNNPAKEILGAHFIVADPQEYNYRVLQKYYGK